MPHGTARKNRRYRALAAAALGCLLAVPAHAQAPGQPPSQRPPGGMQRRPPQPPQQGQSGVQGWVIRASPAANLWFHSLAVIAADQPGPLGLYSADYARFIRDFKQEMGVYPTRLDSIASRLRDDIGDGRDSEGFHFIPLYFPRATPERMLDALRSVARRRPDAAIAGPDVRMGVAAMDFWMMNGGDRGLLNELVDAVEREWIVFYREYWGNVRDSEDSLAFEMQQMWDTRLAPQLNSYLERRRLTAGLVMPSPALGPEGRIMEFEQFVTDDQVVAVQQPLLAQGPEETVFAFLKELCFLLIDDRDLVGRPKPGEEAVELPDGELEDLRRTAAVRCGEAILTFYAPEQLANYRRAFLDAVGAEESATVEAFDRVYYLDPIVAERVHEQIRAR